MKPLVLFTSQQLSLRNADLVIADCIFSNNSHNVGAIGGVDVDYLRVALSLAGKYYATHQIVNLDVLDLFLRVINHVDVVAVAVNVHLAESHFVDTSGV